jgi:3-oxoacyl-[acyl-carrier protein] reductase
MNQLQNKVAIVTGGAQGIGKAIVERFAKEGATVVIWDVQFEKANLLASLLRAQKTKVEAMQNIDIRNLEQVQTAAQTVFEKYGRIDILVNNAGIVRDSTLQKMTAENWQDVIDVNLTGVFNCTKAVSAFMLQNQYGRVLSISSTSGIFGNFGQTNYVAAKAGVAAMTKTWGRELGKYGITANAIAPGPIATDMLATIPDAQLEQMIQRIPVKRTGKPEDIAASALFFCSEEASFITGQTLVVDGGTFLG